MRSLERDNGRNGPQGGTDYRSPNDPLAKHRDFTDLMNRRQQGGENVISHRGWQEPTPRQLRYIAKLAQQTGRKVPRVMGRQGASRSIAALRGSIIGAPPIREVPMNRLRRTRTALIAALAAGALALAAPTAASAQRSRDKPARP